MTLPLIFGHRGASANFPENTIPSFLGALKQHADGVELDVRRCGTGEVVVCHDSWLDRLADAHLQVTTTSLACLRTLEIAQGGPRARIPLLEEVFEALPRTVEVNVELKCETIADGGLCAEVARLIRQRGEQTRVILSSFNPACLIRSLRACPEVRRGLLLKATPYVALEAALWTRTCAVTSIHPDESLCTGEQVDAWHRAGLRVTAWTVNLPERARELSAMGVDTLITNAPGAIRAALNAPRTTRVRPSARLRRLPKRGRSAG